jgi:hypothetical protein
MYNLKRLKRIFQEVFVKNVALKKKKKNNEKIGWYCTLHYNFANNLADYQLL